MVSEAGLPIRGVRAHWASKTDAKRKAKAMYLIGEEYAMLAELLGGGDDVTYLEFQTAMLKRDRERRLYG